MSPHDVLTFWFVESTPRQWFKKDTDFDELIRSRFAEVHAQAMRGETTSWRESPDGRLAEIIVLDQFSRNLFRNLPEAFAGDLQALICAKEVVAVGAEKAVASERRLFFYMPYMHSESPAVHAEALPLFEALDDARMLKYEKMHKDIIDRFGRYPSRNAALGRTSTPEELEFLKTHEFF